MKLQGYGPILAIVGFLSVSNAQAQIIGRSDTFQQAGYSFIFINQYRAISIPSAQNTGLGPVILEFSYPKITSPLTQQAFAFNKAVKMFAQKTWTNQGAPTLSDEKSDTDTDFSLLAGVVPDQDSYHIAEENQNNTIFIPDVISIGFTFSSFCHGCNDAYVEPAEFNWIISKERGLTSSDVFGDKTAWKMNLINLVSSKKNRANWATQANIPHLTVDPSRWILTSQGLEIAYRAAEIEGCNCGGDDEMVIIPWTELTRYLRKNGVVPPPN